MNLVECSNGHFYDDERFSCCPYCNAADSMSNASPSGPTQLDLTADESSAAFNWDDKREDSLNGETMSEEKSNSTKTDTELKKEVGSVKEPVNIEEELTVGVTVGVDEALGSPVVGWLVCVQGNHLGMDFKLKAGGNFIGRSSEMDVAIIGDASVSRKKHAVVIYEPKNNIFILQPGESKGLTYLNDKIVLTPTELSSNDIIQVGNTKLMFIPCCSDKFTWDGIMQEETL